MFRPGVEGTEWPETRMRQGVGSLLPHRGQGDFFLSIAGYSYKCLPVQCFVQTPKNYGK